LISVPQELEDGLPQEWKTPKQMMKLRQRARKNLRYWLTFLRSSGNGNSWFGIPHNPVPSQGIPTVADSFFQDAG